MKGLMSQILKEEHLAFERSVHKILSTTQLEAKKETINKILAYASSVRAIKMKSNTSVLISLN